MINCLIQKKFQLPIDFATVAADWKRRGYSCNLFTDPPGREWRDFVHSGDELVTVVNGQLQMTIQGQQWVLEPGDEIFIPRGAIHTMKNTYTTTINWFYGYCFD